MDILQRAMLRRRTSDGREAKLPEALTQLMIDPALQDFVKYH
jgi:hypothetical protein